MTAKQDVTFPSHDGRTMIHAVRWAPEGTPRAVVQIVHGMAEYIDRYAPFASYLAEQGYLVTGEDHLGHGQSVAEGMPYGYFCERNAADVVVADVHTLRELTEQMAPGVPYILFGHSMGSFIVREYLTQHGAGLKGAVIQGTGMQPASLAKTGKAIAAIQGVFTGKKHPSGLLNAISFGGYLKGIQPLRTKMDWLSYNEENVDRYIADPLCGFTFTVNGFQTLLEFVLRTGDTTRIAKIPKELPVYVASGQDDPVGEHGAAVQRFFDTYGQTVQPENARIKLYPKMRHEILFEDGAQEVFEDYRTWIEALL